LLTKKLVETADEKQSIWRVACMNRIEAALEEHSNRQSKLSQERPRVLREVPKRTACFERLGVTIDRDTVDLLVTFFVTLSFRADDRHTVARGSQCSRFLPDAPVERARQILDDDEHSPPGASGCGGDRADRLTFDL